MSGKLNWPEEGVFESSRSIDCRLSAATVLEVAVLNTLFVPWSLNGLVALPKPYSVSVIQTLSDHSHLQQYCNLTIKYYRKNISQGIAVKSPFRLALFIPSKASLWWQYGVPTFLAWKCSLAQSVGDDFLLILTLILVHFCEFCINFLADFASILRNL